MPLQENTVRIKPPPQVLWKDLRRIFSLSEPYRKRLYGALLLSLAAASISLVIPLGLRELVDTVFQDGNRGFLDRLALFLFGLFVVQAIISFFGTYHLAWTGERVVADFRKRIYTHLQSLSLRFFNSGRIGDLTSRLTNDVSAVRVAVTDALADLVTVSLRLAGSVALILALNWRLSILILVVLPAAALATRYFGGKLRALSRRVQDRLADTTAVAEEALFSIRVVLAFGRQSHEVQRYGSTVEVLFDAARHRALFRALFSALITLLFFSAIAAIFWYGGIEVLAGRLSVGDLIAFLFYAMNISRGISTLSNIYAAFNSAAGASERLFEILDTHPEIRDVPGAAVLSNVRGHLQFQGVSFGYSPQTPVLDDVSFEVRPGETVALVGPSGAGKSTLLSLIPRFFDPGAGQILIDGNDLRSVQLLSLREQIAIVSQDVQLFNDTIRENVRYGRLNASDEDVEDAARAANAHEFILGLPKGYDTITGERGIRLSGGQKQRVAIARALLKQSPILLLDEATSSLDTESELLVKEALDHLMHNRTSLVVAHRLSTVRDANRILVLQDGRIVEEGTHLQLSSLGGLYSRLAAGQLPARPGEPGTGLLDGGRGIHGHRHGAGSLAVPGGLH